MGGATTTERPGATGADRGTPNTEQKPGDQKPGDQRPGQKQEQQKQGEPEQKPGEPIPGRTMKDGPVVQLTTRFGGTNQRPNHGSGFLVGPEGQKNEPIDGQRFIATAHHVVGENHANSDTRKIYETLGQDFANTDGNGDKVLSKEEIGKKINELENAPTKDRQNKEQTFQFKHLNDNFDEISKISKELNPSAPDGISEQGLREYYRRNTDITVDTKRGTFKAELADVNDRSDTALLKMKLDPRVEKALGDNIPLARDFRQGERIQAEGYPGVNTDSGLLRFYHQAAGKLKITGRDETGGRHISEMSKTFPGMSGGPTRNSKGEALGVNSADAELDGKNYLYTGPASDLREMLRKQKGR